MVRTLFVGVFRDGVLLFRIRSGFRSYVSAAFACALYESARLSLEPGDYIACDWENIPWQN